MNDQVSFDAYNEFLWEGRIDRYTKILSRYELFRNVIDLPGDIVECGVFKGHGLLFWARLVQIFNPMSQRRVVGFDTFEGVPDTVKGESDQLHGQAFKNYADVPDIVAAQAAALGFGGRIETVKGDALTSIAAYAAERPGFRVALLNIDFDVYEPCKAALEALIDRMVPGGIIMFDEYAVHQWGESNAADEVLRPRGLALKAVPWSMSPTAYTVISFPSATD
jgi:hypothetical protein